MSKDVLQVIVAIVLFLVIAATSQLSVPEKDQAPKKNGVIAARNK